MSHSAMALQRNPLRSIAGDAVRTVVLKRMVDAGVDAETIANASTIRWPKTGPLWRHLLGTSLKVEKSKAVGWYTAVVYLAPEKEAEPYAGKINLCPFASASCPGACLAGNAAVSRLAMDSGRNAKAWKTLLYKFARELYLAFLDFALEAHKRSAGRRNLIPAIRLNGSSDVVWETVAPEIFAKHSDVTFYDYTKIYTRFDRPLPKNYHLTFSRSEDISWRQVTDILSRGINVAVVFTDSTPIDAGEFRGETVVNGDVHDARPTDDQNGGRGVIVGLSVKSHASDGGSGFFLDPNAATN